MPSLTYLDQNALIALGRKARHKGSRQKLDGALESKLLSVVVSSWHLIETARTTNVANATELAEFIDSLNPGWLFERFNLQRLDVLEDFYRYLKIEFTERPRVTTRSEVFAELNHAKDSPRFEIASADFVTQWVKEPNQLAVLEETYKKNAATLVGLRALKKAGKITEDVRNRVNEILLRVSLPKTTPAGLHMGHDVKIDYVYVQQVKAENISSIAIETAISEHEWDSQGGLDGNTLIDKMHLISALPHVDEIVSDDNFFHDVYPAAAASGHVRAALIHNAEFLQRLGL
jgi:hypothetical protein